MMVSNLCRLAVHHTGMSQGIGPLLPYGHSFKAQYVRSGRKLSLLCAVGIDD